VRAELERLESILGPKGGVRPTRRVATERSAGFVEDKRPLCQLSSKRYEDDWQSGLLSSTGCGEMGEIADVKAGQHHSGDTNCESERQDEEQMPRETGTRQGRTPPTGDLHRGGEQMPRETGTRQGRTPPTGDPHRGEEPAEDPPPKGRATQGTHTEHTRQELRRKLEQNGTMLRPAAAEGPLSSLHPRRGDSHFSVRMELDRIQAFLNRV